MSFFISDALAQPASAATPESSLLSFLPLIGIFVLFYFLLIRPQMKRAKEHKTLLNALLRAPASFNLGFTTDDREAVEALLARAGVDGLRRGETLSLPEFARIANAFAPPQE